MCLGMRRIVKARSLLDFKRYSKGSENNKAAAVKGGPRRREGTW
jgi:hypothetical protein